MIAVIKTGGKQYIVREGQTIKLERIQADAGDVISFDSVLLRATEDGAVVDIGTPILTSKAIAGTVVRQGRGKKITVIKFKPKVRYRRKRGHRQAFTEITIGQV